MVPRKYRKKKREEKKIARLGPKKVLKKRDPEQTKTGETGG